LLNPQAKLWDQDNPIKRKIKKKKQWSLFFLKNQYGVMRLKKKINQKKKKQTGTCVSSRNSW
jgi:hypothetical protein